MSAIALTLASARDPLTLQLQRGQTLGVIGEIAPLPARIGALFAGRPEQGSLLAIDGEDASPGGKLGRQKIRREVGVLRPLAEAPLNPRWTIAQILEEPLRALRPDLTRQTRTDRLTAAMAQIGMDAAMLRARPGALGPLTQQLVALLRALVSEPSLLVALDPFAGLEAEDQARLANHLLSLAETGPAVLLIQPDLAMAAHLADRIAVIAGEHVLEEGPASDLRLVPQTRYARQIAAATRPF